MPCDRQILRLLLAASAFAFAGRAPVDRSWRSLGMGGAGVAVVDDAQAIHLNPAGLTQIGAKGTFAPLDSLGYKRNTFDLRLIGIGVDPSAENLPGFQRFWNRHKATIDSATNEDPIVLAKNQRLLDDIYAFDRKPLPLNISADIEAAFHDWGAAVWSQGEVAMQLDHGAITPKAALRVTTTSAVELATAQAFMDDRLSLGFGYRIVARSRESREYDIIELNTDGSSAPEKMLRNTASKVSRASDWGHGFDLGALWFQTPSLRFGGSLRGVGMRLEGKIVTPNLSLGLAWAPKSWQVGQIFTRRVNFAAELEDVLYDTLGYKPLSKIGFGVEFTQTLHPYLLETGISAGVKGGYPTLLLSATLWRLVRCEALTYGEETGYFTGDRENRVWMARVGIGL
jgi:hypothetical protein